MPDIPNGYYWLVADKLRAGVVLVRDGKYYVPGKLFGRKIESISEHAELRPGAFNSEAGIKLTPKQS